MPQRACAEETFSALRIFGRRSLVLPAGAVGCDVIDQRLDCDWLLAVAASSLPTQQDGRHQRLVLLAFAGSVGMTLVILGCALPQYSNWWPLFVLLFYCLAPLPTLLSRRYNDSGSNNSCLETAIFITMGFVVSAFALPIILARSPSETPTIEWGACYLVLSGNVVVFLTMLGFFITFDNEDLDYSMW